MSKTYVSIPEAPEFDPGYAQAVRAGNTVYVHGTTGFDVAAGAYGPSITEQTRQALLNCQMILRAAGAELSDVVTVTTLLRRSEDAPGVSKVFAEFFPEMEPPRCVARLGVDRPELLISLVVVAVLD